MGLAVLDLQNEGERSLPCYSKNLVMEAKISTSNIRRAAPGRLVALNAAG